MRKLIETFGICTRTKCVTKKIYEGLFSFCVQIKMSHIIGNLHTVSSCRSLSLVFLLTHWDSHAGISLGVS